MLPHVRASVDHSLLSHDGKDRSQRWLLGLDERGRTLALRRVADVDALPHAVDPPQVLDSHALLMLFRLQTFLFLFALAELVSSLPPQELVELTT